MTVSSSAARIALPLALALSSAETSLAQAQPAPTASPASGSPSPKPALADSLTGEARADYAAARILYEDGDYRGALIKLRESYDLAKDPRLLWNMAACEKSLRNYAATLNLVERYVQESGASLSESDRAEATTLIDTAKAFVSELSVTSNEAGATVYFDGQPIGVTPLAAPVRVDMGTHQVRVAKRGFVDYTSTQSLVGGHPLAVAAVLTAERHQGRLRVLADAPDVIAVDGKSVATGVWEGELASGMHAISVTSKNKLPHRTEVVVLDGQTSTVHVALQPEPPRTLMIEHKGLPAWAWIAGGVVVAGAGVGAYFLLKPGDARYATPTEGNWGALSL